jgi:predicted DNA-binding protein
MSRKGQRILPDEERRKRQIAIRLTEEEFRSLESIAKKKDLPLSRFIREGIGLVIEKYLK